MLSQLPPSAQTWPAPQPGPQGQAARTGDADQQTRTGSHLTPPPQAFASAPPVPGASPINWVAPVVLPAAPMGTTDRVYWYGAGLPVWPTRSLSRWIRGPIRSAFRR